MLRPSLGESRRTRVNHLYGAIVASTLERLGHPLAALPHGSAVLVELGRLHAVLDAERFERLVAVLPAVPNVKALARSLRALRLGKDSAPAALEIDSEGKLVQAPAR